MNQGVLILGVGNLLLGDEGVGVHVVQRLQHLPLPRHVQVMDGGTIGYELLPYLSGKRKVIIVDALMADELPGSLIRLAPDQVDSSPTRPPFVHQGGVQEFLHFAQRLEPRPEIVLYGVVARSFRDMTVELSPEVEGRMTEILNSILEEARLDASPAARGDSGL